MVLQDAVLLLASPIRRDCLWGISGTSMSRIDRDSIHWGLRWAGRRDRGNPGGRWRASNGALGAGSRPGEMIISCL